MDKSAENREAPAQCPHTHMKKNKKHFQYSGVVDELLGKQA